MFVQHMLRVTKPGGKMATVVPRIDFPEIAKEGAVPSVNQRQVGSLEVPWPSSSEQVRIATIIDTIDHAIRKTEEVIAKLEQMKRGLLHDLLTRGIDENGELRDPVAHPEQFTQTEVGLIPGEWVRQPLASVAKVSYGLTLGRVPRRREAHVEMPYLRVGNVKDGYLDLSKIKTVEVPEDHVERYRLLAGDVLMTEGGDYDKLGRGTVWRGELENCLHQNHVFRVRPNRESVDPFFLSAITSSQYGKTYFLLNSKQTTNARPSRRGL